MTFNVPEKWNRTIRNIEAIEIDAEHQVKQTEKVKNRKTEIHKEF